MQQDLGKPLGLAAVVNWFTLVTKTTKIHRTC